jgi:hypothetical protein
MLVHHSTSVLFLHLDCPPQRVYINRINFINKYLAYVCIKCKIFLKAVFRKKYFRQCNLLCHSSSGYTLVSHHRSLGSVLDEPVGFVVDNMALEQDLLQVSSVSPPKIIIPSLHTHPSLPSEIRDSPEQTAHFHTTKFLS